MPDHRAGSPLAIVAGYFVRYPLGGHALSILHYLVGLKRLGYAVVFVEEHGWPDSCYDPRTNTVSDDPAYGLAKLREWFAACGLDAWCYVDAAGAFHGLPRADVERLCRDADVLISLWRVTWLDAFAACRRRVFVDTDPGFTQFDMGGGRSAPGGVSPLDFDVHFTYGVRIGEPDCPIPTHGLRWHPLRPPVSLDLVTPRFTPEASRFTTVMSWSARQPIVYEGVEYGQKDIEFWRIAELPARAGRQFEVALAGRDAPRELIAAAGWRLADPRRVTETPWTYLEYISRSRGEFSVAVNLEVKARSGWFSDRTAAYLAAGKPAIVQDTGFSESLPCGQGLMAFSTLDEAASAVEHVNRDYDEHCRAARAIAERYFDAAVLLTGLLERAGCEVP
jgi:hypothetical protein